MATVQVSPTSLRAAGEDLRDLRENVVTNRRVHMLHGYGDDQHFSTDGFDMGVQCQQRLSTLYDEAQEAFKDTFQNLVALCSAMYIVADLYHSTDQRQALEFAFLNAEAPGRLPSHIDPERTSRTYAQQYETQAALAGGNLPTGWTRQSFDVAPGVSYTEFRDANGKVMGYTYEYNTGGPTRTVNYNPDGTAINTVEHDPTTGVTRTYNGEARPENLVREEVQTTTADGGTHYETRAYRDGETTTTNQYDVGPQTEPVERGESIVRGARETNELTDGLMTRAEGGYGRGITEGQGEYGELPYDVWYGEEVGNSIDRHMDEEISDWEYEGPPTRP